MIRDDLHLRAPGNWLNDPNGFIYYKGEYHLFYQHFPYAPRWGTMHWGHAVSPDLVHWRHLGVALFPTKDYDRNGVFSGTALESDGALRLYYSAVRYLQTDGEDIHLAAGDRFETSQALVTSPDGRRFDNWEDKRQVLPVLTDPALGDRKDTRDPRVWRDDRGYCMLLGSTLDGMGRVLFYRSGDGLSWTYANQFASPELGRILECPDLFPLGEGWLFLGSPMWSTDDGLTYPHQAMYARADFDPETCRLSLAGPMTFLDWGLDLYAPGEGGGGACQEGFDALAGALNTGGSGGLRVRSLSRGEVGYDQDLDVLKCPVEAGCQAYLYASAQESGSFTDFVVKGEIV